MREHQQVEHLLGAFRDRFRPVSPEWCFTPDWLAGYCGVPGKHLRPLLFLASYLMVLSRKVGAKKAWRELVVDEGVWNIATCLERLHIGACAVDDVIDESTERHGVRTMYLQFRDWAAGVDWGYDKDLAWMYSQDELHGFRAIYLRGDLPQRVQARLGRRFNANGFANAAIYTERIVAEFETSHVWGHGEDGALWCRRKPPAGGALTLDFLTQTIVDLWQAILQAGKLLTAEAGEIGQRHLCYGGSYGKEDFVDTRVVGDTLGNLIADLRLSRTKAGICLWLYELLEVYLDVLQKTLDGERADAIWAQRNELPSLSDVFWLQKMKTTWYSIWLPVATGALLADPTLTVPSKVMTALMSYCLHFGEGFQIFDDLLLFQSDEAAGKNVRQDLANGSPTIPIVMMNDMLRSRRQKGRWLDLLRECRDSDEAQDEALRQMRSCGVVEQCRGLIDQRTRWCRASLTEVEAEGYQTALLAFLGEQMGWMDDARVAIV